MVVFKNYRKGCFCEVDGKNHQVIVRKSRLGMDTPPPCRFFLQILKVEHKTFPMMYHLLYLDIKNGVVSWFSSTPAGIMLTYKEYIIESNL